jgi:ribose transport system substrate-binding protein
MTEGFWSRLPSTLRTVTASGLLVALVFVVAACGSSSSDNEPGTSTGAAAPAGTKIGAGKKVAIVFPGTPAQAYYFDVVCGAREEGKRLGFDVLKPQGPKQSFDVAGQAQIVQAVLAAKPDALLYDPADGKAGGIGIKAAVAKGLPVVAIDTQLNDPSLYITFSASDQTAGGKMGGDLLAKQVGAAGKVAVMGILPDNPITVGRVRGMKEALANYPNVQIVSTLYPEPDVNKNAAQASALLTKYPDLKGIYVTNNISMSGLASALRQAHKVGKVKVVTWDAQPETVKMIRDGIITGTVGQYPRIVGRQAIQQLANHFANKPVQKIVSPPNKAITSDTIDDPDIKAFIQENYSATAC